MSTSSYTVSGMTCGHCVGTVKSEIGKVAGVTAVDVDLATGKVTVTGTGPVDDTLIQNAVENAGYELTRS
ncbi:heavy-metal-associated domain-containing protein [Thermoactinospora rubra]|uniref:heavy-metal-associated domain-containing protein n=1 Tax=Thermoactinospora rubra TaxID=1088767 RepID=UPI000A123282|nr:heavy metal-associated domain-containing protein [Thermoactinospora rubra]